MGSQKKSKVGEQSLGEEKQSGNQGCSGQYTDTLPRLFRLPAGQERLPHLLPEVQNPLTVMALFWKARTSSCSAGPFWCTVIAQSHLALTAYFKNPLQPLKNGEPP